MPKHPRIGSDPLDDIPTRAAPSKRKRTPSTPNADRKRSTPSTPNADRKRSTSRKAAKDASPDGAAEWDASHVRVTFYCPVSLLGQVEQEVSRSGRSKTRVIVDAIQGHLKAK